MNEKFSHGCSSFLALGPALSVTGRLIFLVAQDGKEQERLAKEGKKKRNPNFYGVNAWWFDPVRSQLDGVNYTKLEMIYSRFIQLEDLFEMN